MLEFNVRHQRLSRVDSFRPAENSVNYLHAKIKFLTNEWTGSVRLRAKSKSDTIVHEADIVEGCVQIPWEALRNTDGFSVSVYTRNGDIEITTNYVDIYLSGTLPGGAESNPPTPTELELIRQEVNGLRNDVDNLEGEGLANAVADYLEKNPVEVSGVVKTINGIAPDENGNVEISVSSDSSQNGNGLSADEKSLILTLFKAVQYDENVKATLAQLEVLWTGGSTITYKVQNILSNASNSNTTETVTGGMAYTATLTADEGYVLDTVSVTMDGIDVTADVYADGKISILSVSGDVVITATTINLAIVAPVYSLEEATTFDGTSNIDTGYRLFDTDKDFTVCLDFESGATRKGAVICEHDGSIETYFGVCLHSSYYWAVQYCKTNGNYYNVGHGGGKYVITRTAGSTSLTTYYVIDGAKTTGTQTVNSIVFINNLIANGGTLKIGGDENYQGRENYFIGTVNALDIYERILDDSEINEFLGV